MKTIKQLFKIVLIIGILFPAHRVFSQDRQESFNAIYNLKAQGSLYFSCYESDLKINTWDKEQVKFEGKITISGGSEKDQQQLIEIFKEPQVSNTGSNYLKIETDISKSTVINGPFMKITLVSGKMIKVKKYKTEYTLWMPESAALELKSKYNHIDISKITGDLDFNLHDANLDMENFENGKFDLKYCSIKLGKGKTVNLNTYDSKIKIESLETLTSNSKYSEFDIGKLESITIESYDDKYKIKEINKATGKLKYTSLYIENKMNLLKLNMYDSNIKAGDINNLNISGKYNTIHCLDVKNVSIEEFYDSQLTSGNIHEFICNTSKYGRFKIASVSGFMDMPNTYDSKIWVNNIKEGFEHFEGNFKYGSVSLNLNTNLEYSFELATTYTDLKFPENITLKYSQNEKDGEKFNIKATTKENPDSHIRFTAYDVNLDFK